MSQIIENWTDVSAKVKSVQPSTQVPGHLQTEIEVTDAAPVTGFPNLLEDTPGRTLTVLVRQGVPAERRLKAGGKIHLRLRRAGPSQIFAHPD